MLKERWIGITGKRTTLNGQEVSTRTCADLSQAYLYAFLLFPLQTYISWTILEWKRDNRNVLETGFDIFYLLLLTWLPWILQFICSQFHFIFSLPRYTTSPHLFSGDAEEAFIRVRDKVCCIFFCTVNIGSTHNIIKG